MTGLGTGPHTGNGHDPTAAQPPRTGADRLSTEIELWEVAARLAQLTRTELLIYIVIRAHALDGAGRAFPSLSTIAREAGCARRHVPDAINRLVTLGLIAKQQRRSTTGAFNSTVYTLIEPALGSDAQVTRWGRTGHQVVTSGSPEPLKRTKVTERTPPCGGVARASEGGDFSNDEVDRKQGVLLLPTTGGGDRKARLAVIDIYEPSPALIELAGTLGVNARAENVFGRWKRTRIADNRLPLDERAAEADFENWIRNQPAYDEREHARAAAIGSPRQPRAPRRDAMAEILARVQAAEAAEAAQ